MIQLSLSTNNKKQKVIADKYFSFGFNGDIYYATIDNYHSPTFPDSHVEFKTLLYLL